ncbi:MAG: hypothetical protein ACI3XC_01790, partial [Phascolarctobacterium sp.]
KVLGWKRPGRIDSCRLKKDHTLKVWSFSMIKMEKSKILGNGSPGGGASHVAIEYLLSRLRIELTAIPLYSPPVLCYNML